MSPATQQILLIVLPLLVLALLLLISVWYSTLKFRALKLAQGQDEVATARHGLRKAGLVIMAVPVAIILGFTVFVSVAYGGFPGYGLIYSLPLVAVWLITRRRPLLGASLAAMAAVMLIIPGVGVLVINYEMSGWYGAIMLLLAAILGLGVWTVVKSLPKAGRDI